MKHELSSFYDIGMIFAPWIAHFAAWIIENAQHPVRLLLRDADMFGIVAKELAKTVPDFSSAGAWTSHYMTCGMISALNMPTENPDYVKLMKNRLTPLTMSDIRGMEYDIRFSALEKLLPFMEKDGWYKQSYTVVDTGFMGSIPNSLKWAGFDIQTLLMFSSGDNFDGFYDGLFAYGYFKSESYKRAPELCEMFENTPKEFKSVYIHDVSDDGDLKVVNTSLSVLAAHGNFTKGLRDGAKRIAQIGMGDIPDPKTIISRIESHKDQLKHALNRRLDVSADRETLHKLADTIYEKDNR